VRASDLLTAVNYSTCGLVLNRNKEEQRQDHSPRGSVWLWGQEPSTRFLIAAAAARSLSSRMMADQAARPWGRLFFSRTDILVCKLPRTIIVCCRHTI
jgi:hypothetical protein